MREIRILAIRVGQDPIIEEIKPTLEALQKFVDGYIEIVPLEDACLVVDETGLYNKPFNRQVPAKAPEVAPDFDVIVIQREGSPPLARPGEMGIYSIHGDFFVCQQSGDGEMISISDTIAEKYQTLLALCPQCHEKTPAYAGAIYCGAACAAKAGA